MKQTDLFFYQVGKHLALNELRHVLSAFVTTFDVAFAKDFDTKTWQEEIKDVITLHLPPLPVDVKMRK